MAAQSKVAKETLKFGQTTTDHLLEVDWSASGGWGKPAIVPYHPFSIDPASSVLHYALECFEGMKAYLDAEGKVRLFRPDKNIERLRASMARLAFPDFEPAAFQACLERLVLEDKDWIPQGDGFSLYIRPTAISTHPYLGVSVSSSVKLYVILCPVGPYYPEGFKPVSLYADAKNVRAWPGGTGHSKIGANYAPSILPQTEAAKKGFSQVLWLFGDQQDVTEVGTMNMFVHWTNESGEKELITPPLDGTILPGVTRDSILALARGWNEFKVSERRFSMPQLAKAASEGRLHEAFGAGTAAVVSPIKLIHWKGQDYKIPITPQGAGPLAHRLWKDITDIQYGRRPHPWSVRIEK
jgi:branched-chain amino acid aminotransferase